MTRISIIGLFAVLVCRLLVSTASAERVIYAWDHLYEGIESASGYDTSPRLMRAFAIRVSLQNPEVSIAVTPSNGGADGETNGQTTPQFLSAYSLEAAVNANFSWPDGNGWDAWGLLISNGTVVSPGQAGTFSGQLRLTSDKIATLVKSSSTPTGFYDAVGGDGDAWLLTDGVNNNPNPQINPRTGVGISQDGKSMIWVVVDGRQPGWSEGCNAKEMGQWMLDFGAWNAMVLDGGGSSCLCSAVDGVYNRPSDGQPRTIGANLGAHSSAATTYGPSVVSKDSTTIDLVKRGKDNAVKLMTWDGSSWSAETSLGGSTSVTPAIASWASNRLDVFERGSLSHIYHKSWDGATWSAYADLGNTAAGGVTAVSPDVNRIVIAVRDTTNHIDVRRWTGTSWASWQDLGGTANDDPAICSWSPTRLDIFLRSGNTLYKKYSNDGGATWSSSWSSRGGNITSAPAAVSWGDGRIDVFARGADNTIHHMYYNNNTWSNWESISRAGGSSIASSPTVSSKGPGQLDVFYRGTNDHLYHKSFNGTWSAWIDEGPYY